jgi:hypothetical protein
MKVYHGCHIETQLYKKDWSETYKLLLIELKLRKI